MAVDGPTKQAGSTPSGGGPACPPPPAARTSTSGARASSGCRYPPTSERPGHRVARRYRRDGTLTGYPSGMPSAIGFPETLVEAAELVRARKLSPIELAQEGLARTEALQPRLDAFTRIPAGRPLDGAASAEEEIAAGRH